MEEKVEAQWAALAQEKELDHYTFPRISVVIPCRNHAHSISLTLESVLTQDYPELEVIVIDAASTDRTFELIKSFFDERIRVASVSTFERYEMFNKGISLATGKYIHFLLPGDQYIHPRASKVAMASALDNSDPHLLYAGCLFRDGRSEPKILFRQLNKELLQQGKQPTSLQSCWFRNDTFRTMGKFRAPYHLRGGYELLCRFVNDPFLRAVGVSRVLTDFHVRGISRQMVMDHFKGTFSAIWRHFGWWTLFRWLFIQRDLVRLIQLSYRKVRAAFFGQ